MNGDPAGRSPSTVEICERLVAMGLRRMPRSGVDLPAAEIALRTVAPSAKLLVVLGREAILVILVEAYRQIAARADAMGVRTRAMATPTIGFHDEDLNDEERTAIDWCLGALRAAIQYLREVESLDLVRALVQIACERGKALDAAAARDCGAGLVRLLAFHASRGSVSAG